jgi:hypothetical protein
LETDADGRSNWGFFAKDEGLTAAAGEPDQGGGDADSPIGFLAGLGEARIEGGAITYTSAGASPVQVNLDQILVKSAGPNAALELEGTLDWDGAAIRATVTTASLDQLADTLSAKICGKSNT